MIRELISLFHDASKAYWILFKVMLPMLILVRLLDVAGGIALLGVILEPVMSWVHLPAQLGLVWATILLTNIYGGFLILVQFPLDTPLTVAQATTFSCLMLIGHALPVEGAIAKRMGVSWRITLPLRTLGAFLLAFMVAQLYHHFSWGQQSTQLLWQPEYSGDSWYNWAKTQLESLVSIYFVVLGLMALLRTLHWLGIEKWVHVALFPLLRFIGIGKSAANIAVVGSVLGVTFGAGLLLKEKESEHLSKRDILLTMCFLGLCHSLVEDTLLALSIGADIHAVLWGRLVFALLVIATFARLISQPARTHSPDPVRTGDA